MSKYIHPATTEAALSVASNLLPDDYREVVEGHGHDPLNALVVGVQNSDSVYFTNPDDEICGIAGVYPNGAIWMVCTSSILTFTHPFGRAAKRCGNSQAVSVLWLIGD